MYAIADRNINESVLAPKWDRGFRPYERQWEQPASFATTEYDPQVKVVKDVAAGAVLISAITAVVVGLLIIGPKLLEKLMSLAG